MTSEMLGADLDYFRTKIVFIASSMLDRFYAGLPAMFIQAFSIVGVVLEPA